MQALAYINPIVYGLLVLALILYGWAARFVWLALQHRKRTAEYLAIFGDPAAVDVWAMQKDMMERSAQRIPSAPRLHNGALLYAALNAEELGELMLAIGQVLYSVDPADKDLVSFAERFLVLSAHLDGWSKGMRETLSQVDIGDHAFTGDEVVAVFDATTDLMVTNAGFALSCGLPGAAGYAEVQDSNLSKANPATGKIDKTADGKWIKGVNYREPNLMGILLQHNPKWAQRNNLIR